MKIILLPFSNFPGLADCPEEVYTQLAGYLMEALNRYVAGTGANLLPLGVGILIQISMVERLGKLDRCRIIEVVIHNTPKFHDEIFVNRDFFLTRLTLPVNNFSG